MLDARKASILTAVVEEYIETAQPVGSGAVTEAAGGVSAATVRNEMAVLEADGFLTQPHTSAGRLPTEKAYRYFVNAVGQGTLNLPESRRVSDFFLKMQGEIEDMLRNTASLLSGLTDYAAVVVDNSTDTARVLSVQLVPLAPRVILVVVVLANGSVDKFRIEPEEALDDEELESAVRAVMTALDGRLPSSPRQLELTGVAAVDAVADQVLKSVGSASDPDGVYVDGASRVVDAFDAVHSVRRVLTILEQQLVVVNVLSDVLDRGLNVAIGTETGVERLEECSVVVAPYEIEGERAGSIAVLGPTRMHYPQAMAAVAAVSRQLGKRLSEG